MTFDFDRPIERRGTGCVKYDFAAEMGKPLDALPLWVADMDFAAPPAVTEALAEAVAHGIFGYSGAKDDYFEAVAAWFDTRFGWRPDKSWLIKTPGVVFALALAVRTLTEPGDAVLIQTPVYYPFSRVVLDNGRRLVENPLRYADGRYTIDFEDLEEKLVKQQVKMAILCSPHNPVCRVWTRQELARMGELFERYGVYVISDEIHCDFAFPEHPHTVFLQACPQLAERTVICTAPSKSFNLAGLQTSNIFVPSPEIREKFTGEMSRMSCNGVNALGLVAAKAAYSGGGEWLDACKVYMRENLDSLRSFLQERLPRIRLAEPEGTYFAWLDCSELHMTWQELDDLVLNRAKVWLDGGHMFGTGGDAFQRVVLACTRKTLTEALTRLEGAVNAL